MLTFLKCGYWWGFISYEVGLVYGASLKLGWKNPLKIYISLGSESRLLEHLFRTNEIGEKLSYNQDILVGKGALTQKQ